jgi:hypothetical protein
MTGEPLTAIFSGMEPQVYCLLASLALGSAAGPAGEAPLKALLGEAVSIKGATVEVCADNACERVSGGPGSDPALIRDFAFLYFLFVSKSGPRHVTMIERNHALSLIATHGARKGLNGVPSALRSLARRGRLSVFSVRQDQGQRVEVSVSLEDRLRDLEEEIERYLNIQRQGK